MGLIDPAYNPGGIWAPVEIELSGLVQMSYLRATCVEAGPRRAVIELSAGLDSAEALTVTLLTEVRRSGGGETAAAVEKQQPLAVGANAVRWRLVVTEPDLWWPAGLGDQALYDICVSVEARDERACAQVLRTGLREVRENDLVWSVNGERIFLKGANLAPTRRDIAYASASEVLATWRWRGTRGSTLRVPRTSAVQNFTTPLTNWAFSCGRTCPCTGVQRGPPRGGAAGGRGGRPARAPPLDRCLVWA